MTPVYKISSEIWWDLPPIKISARFRTTSMRPDGEYISGRPQDIVNRKTMLQITTDVMCVLNLGHRGRKIGSDVPKVCFQFRNFVIFYRRYLQNATSYHQPVKAKIHYTSFSVTSPQTCWRLPRSKSTTSPQHKRQVCKKLARAKVCCVVSIPKLYYNDLLPTCWPCR